jgi:hypothetical protein
MAEASESIRQILERIRRDAEQALSFSLAWRENDRWHGNVTDAGT